MSLPKELCEGEQVKLPEIEHKQDAKGESEAETKQEMIILSIYTSKEIEDSQ